MTNLPNHKDLFRWKRRTDPIVHPSDGRKDVGVRSEEDEVQRWLKRVEAATDVAAHQTFDSEPNPTADGASNLHRHFSNNIRFHEQSSEIAYAEAQDLLNDWMTKNFIHDLIGQETEEEVNYERSPSPTYFQSDVAEAVKTNIHIETLYDNIEAINENDVVQNIMANLLEAPIESNVLNITKSKKNTAEPVTKQLKTKPTKNMMVKLLEEEENKKLEVNLKERSAKRHEQVRKNRVLREQEIQQEREKRLAMRELTLEAKHMVVKEETDAATRRGKEEEAIRSEMARIKCEMEGEKIREAKELKRQMEEEINQVRRLEEEKQMQIKLQEKTKFEEAKRERERNMKLHTLDIKIRNSQLRTLRIHFSAWHNTIIDDRLRMGQARAIADWRLLMRTWSHWNSKYRILWATQEGQKHLEKMRETQRQQKAATDFYKRQLLLKCLRNWNIWVRQKQLEKEILQEKEETQRKMEAFLKACALNEQDDVDDESEDFSLKNKSISQTDKAKSQPRRLEPWQITKKHVYEGLESIHTTSAPKPAPKSRATYVVDAFQHRHAAQEQMLKTQQEIIKEQQKMLEEMKFLRTQQDLQTQLKMLNLDQANQNKTGSPKATSKDPQIEKKESSSEATQKVLVKTAGGKETNRPNKFVMDMEERAKQRGDRKAELERLKQKKLEEKQDATRKVEEEARKKGGRGKTKKN